jgi:2-polyprenyl-6-methoxyphenol hydroxylase-like FAD-dependent oxidoreductase
MAASKDTAIIGGGLVGCLIGLSMADKDNKVVLIEKKKFNKILSENFSPLSLTANTVDYLKTKKIWNPENLKNTPIYNLDIKLFNSFNTIKISSDELEIPELGQVVDKATLLSHLRALCINNKNIEIIDNIDVELDSDNSKIMLNDKSSIKYKQLFITDGANSKFVEQFNIHAKKISYNQTSFVLNCNYNTSENSAVQIFSKKGVFAVLPGHKKVKSIVATINNKYINSYNFESTNFNKSLLQKDLLPYAKDLYNPKLIYSHPLDTSRLDKWHIKNIFFLGNSSQLLHPFGAQGFNYSVDCIKKIDSVKTELLSGGEFNNHVKTEIIKKRHSLFLGIDITSSLLMRDSFLGNVSSTFLGGFINNSSRIKKRFIKRILNI